MTRRRVDFVIAMRAEWQETGRRLSLANEGLLRFLVDEADYRTGAVRGSIRDLAKLRNVPEPTFRYHLQQLASAGEVSVTPGPNQHSPTTITVVRYRVLTGAGAQLVRNRRADSDAPQPADQHEREVDVRVKTQDSVLLGSARSVRSLAHSADAHETARRPRKSPATRKSAKAEADVEAERRRQVEALHGSPKSTPAKLGPREWFDEGRRLSPAGGIARSPMLEPQTAGAGF
jgi:hypothetical protein